jgi:hypothetical protein
MNEVSPFRLYILRGMYLFIVIGLSIYLWPSVLNPNKHWELMEGQASCMLAAFSLVCLLGLRFPLQMLPVLLWEVIWKTLWLILVPLPQWMAGHVDDSIKPSIFAISMVVLVYIAIPWHYVFTHYVKASGDRWRLREG